MEFSDVVRRRRSVRSYSDRMPDPDLVASVIDRARRAPSAGFSQGIDFLVVDDPAAMAELWEMTEDPDSPTPEEEKAVRPPVLVVVWSDPQRYLARYSAEDKIEFGLDDPDRWPVRFWDIDAGMAAMQLQLAAVDHGLDTWFFGFAHGERALRERFGVPGDRMMCGVIALGYRSEDEQPTGSGTTRPRRPLEEQLHRNGW
jgi:nitroreductase